MCHRCYLCHSERINIIHNGVRDNEKINVLKCSQCGLVFLSSFNHINNNFYESTGMLNFEVDYESYLREGWIDARRRFDYLKEKLVNKSVLDFGCGAGNFVFLAKEIARQADGYEIDKYIYDNLKSRLSAYYNVASYRTQDDLHTGGYDIITLFHVLEHFKDPINELSKIKNLLRENGEIIIEVPNADDALLTLYNSSAFSDFTYWSCHLYLYSNKTIQMLMDRAKMKINYIKQIQRYPLSNHLYWLSQNKPGGHEYWSCMNEDALNHSYETILASIGKADTIICSIS